MAGFCFGAFKYARNPAHLRCEPSNIGVLAKKRQWAEGLIYVSQGRIDEAEFVEKMYAMLQNFNANGWRNEEMYVLSLLDLWADQKRQVIAEANPYYEFYQWAKENYK